MFVDFEDFEDDTSFDLYFVTMHDVLSHALLDCPWPVFAAGFEEAMDVYEVLLQLASEA